MNLSANATKFSVLSRISGRKIKGKKRSSDMRQQSLINLNAIHLSNDEKQRITNNYTTYK